MAHHNLHSQSSAPVAHTRRAILARAAAAAGAISLGAVVALPAVPHARAAVPTAQQTLVIGAKGFSENETVAYMYVLALQHAGVPVSADLKKNLASSAATPALQRGGRNNGIDIFPEYTGTGVDVVLQQTKVAHNAHAYFNAAKSGYEQKYKLTWLTYAPMNDAQGFATTQANAKKYGLHSIADMVKHASQLRLVAAAEYFGRADGPAGVAKVYGSFTFKQTVKVAAVGNPAYAKLTSGQADVSEAFTTDALIKGDNLVALSDPKGYASPDNIAPVVNDAALKAYPKIADTLNKLSPKITQSAILQLNYQADVQGKDPQALAKTFLQQQGLLK